jgi:hypothetical protein
VTEWAGMVFQKFFLRTQTGIRSGIFFFPGIGTANTTPFQPNVGSFFVFPNLLQKKNTAEC